MADTRYAQNPDGQHIAYQVVGDGPVDLAFLPWWWSHLEYQWDDPLMADVLEQLASFSRLILFDVRGVGLSDPVGLDALPTLEQWSDDLHSVLDAVGAVDPVVVGHGDGGLLAAMFASTHADRVRGLVLWDSYARLAADEGYDGFEPDLLDTAMDQMEVVWGTGSMAAFVAPERADDLAFVQRLARVERLSVSPGATGAIQHVLGRADIRSALPSIHTPTLVLHRSGNQYVWPTFGRAVSELIPDARFVELPGDAHLYWVGATNLALEAIEAFATGAEPASRVDRVLASVLFTDIVDSTATVARLGDDRWRELRREHDAIVRRSLTRHRGREVKTLGDGFLATFDGPARAISCAQAVIRDAAAIGVDVRAGIHTGEIELNGDDIGGLAVHLAQRVSAAAAPGEVLVSRTVTDLLAGSGMTFTDRGPHELKGVPGTWQLFAAPAR